MRAVLKTNDPVALSFAQHVLAEAEIACIVFDSEASIMDGSLGVVPRRLMVADGDAAAATAALRAAMPAFAPPETP